MFFKDELMSRDHFISNTLSHLQLSLIITGLLHCIQPLLILGCRRQPLGPHLLCRGIQPGEAESGAASSRSCKCCPRVDLWPRGSLSPDWIWWWEHLCSWCQTLCRIQITWPDSWVDLWSFFPALKVFRRSTKIRTLNWLLCGMVWPLDGIQHRSFDWTHSEHKSGCSVDIPNSFDCERPASCSHYYRSMFL